MSAFAFVRLALDEFEASEGFAGWLADEDLSIALTKGNELFTIGRRTDGSVAIADCQFGLCKGLASAGSQTLFLATRYQIWRLENAIADGQTDDAGHDRLFLPQTAWTTGTLLVRDLAVTPDGDVIFVNGLFSCLSAPSEQLSFEPRWLPPFVSALAPDDRCHLSGLALADGQPAFVTSASRSDAPGGWHEEQRDGGVVIVVPSGDVLAHGLSMPCSPVIRDGRLWLCLGGSGELAAIDLADGSVVAVAQLPGFTRGLALRDGFAVVAVSRATYGQGFSGLPLEERLTGAAADGRCGIFVVELDSGRVAHSLVFAGGAGEIQDLALLPDVRSAAAVSFTGDDAQELVTIPQPGISGDR